MTFAEIKQMEYILKSESSLKRLESLRQFLLSDKWMILLFAIAGLIVACDTYWDKAQFNIYGTVVMAYITGFCVVVSNSVMGWLIPVMYTYLIAIRCYNSFDKFMGIIYLAIPLVCMLLFHLIMYRKKLSIKGSQFLPMLLVSVSIVLGGIGFISPKEYFGGSSIYHMLGMGFGMVLIYCYFNAHIDIKKDFDFADKLIKLMVMVGLFATFTVIVYYLIKINTILDLGRIPFIRWRNNISTILIITMPFAFLRANKKSYSSILGFLFCGAMILTGSRGGMIFGIIELLMCIVLFVLYDKRGRLAIILICLCIAFGFLIFAPQITSFLTYTIERIFNALNGFLLGENTETRVAHYARGIEDFLNRPFFGTGLGYMGNRDIFKNAKGSLCWYHCEPIQIAASFGSFGLLTFGYQFVKRNMLIWKRQSLFNITIFLSYISLELMSLVNPGIFCPLPYLMLVTLFMVVVEKCNNCEALENCRAESVHYTLAFPKRKSHIKDLKEKQMNKIKK